MDDGSIKLMARWRDGDQQAATALFQRYAERLISLTQSRLSAKLAVRLDAQDVVQSAYCSFFVGARDGRYILQQSGDLWHLLAAITLHKLRRQIERHTANKRSIDLERKLPGEGDDPGLPAELLAQMPSAADAAMAADTLEEVLRELDPRQRQMVELKLQGYSIGEIATGTQRSSTYVRRILERVKQRLQRQQAR